jgi:hypothetical protein
MSGMAEIAQELAASEAHRNEIITRALEKARHLQTGDRDGAAELLEIAELVGRAEQAAHGQLVLLLGQVDRVKVAPGGVKAWVATHLDVSDGRARGIAQHARRIGAIPELAEPLASGKVGADTIAVLARTAKAVESTGHEKTAVLTQMLETTRTQGVAAARKHVRTLEHTLDPRSTAELTAKQRARSFLRVIELEDGLCRIEVLLDTVRATVLRDAIDQQAADWIRQAQFDHEQPLPEDVRSIEQINAHALVRLAEVFLSAPPAVRGARFTPTVLFSAPLESSEGDAGLAETVYGDLVPRATLPQPGDAGTHLLEHDQHGQPVRLDGAEIDTDPRARLATVPQRTALAWRDRHCTHPGCTRPPTFSLHAHHHRPYAAGGPTVMKNLALLCSEHHVLAHHRDHGQR